MGQDTDERHDAIIGCGVSLIMTLGLVGVPVSIWLTGRDSIPFLVIYAVALVAVLFLAEEADHV